MCLESIENKNKYYYKTPTFLMVGFCIYIIAWYLQIGVRWESLGAVRFEFLIALFLFVLIIVNQQNLSFEYDITKFVIYYFVCLLISFAFSVDLEQSWFVFFNYVFKFAFMAFFIISLVRGPNELKIFLLTLLFVWLKMGQEGMLGTVTGSMLWMNQGVMRLHGSTGFYFHPNSFSGFAIGTLPFLYYFFPIVNKYFKAILVLQFVFALNIILHTGSRTGYVGFVFFLFYILWKNKGHSKKVILFALLIVLSAPYVPGQYKERFESIFTGEEKAGQSTEKRKEIIADALVVFGENPLGVGIGAFPEARYKKFGRVQDTHNLYLQIATNLGIQGLIVFMILIYKVLKTLKETSGHAKKQLYRMGLCAVKIGSEKLDKRLLEGHLFDLKIMHAVCESVFLFILVRLILGLFGHDLYEIYWWFAIGITISILNIVRAAKKKTEYFENICCGPGEE